MRWVRRGDVAGCIARIDLLGIGVHRVDQVIFFPLQSVAVWEITEPVVVGTIFHPEDQDVLNRLLICANWNMLPFSEQPTPPAWQPVYDILRIIFRRINHQEATNKMIP